MNPGMFKENLLFIGKVRLYTRLKRTLSTSLNESILSHNIANKQKKISAFSALVQGIESLLLADRTVAQYGRLLAFRLSVCDAVYCGAQLQGRCREWKVVPSCS